jgi:pilus assembly protein TadC
MSRRRWVTVVVAAVMVALAIGGWAGPVLGVGVAVGARHWLVRAQSRVSLAERRRVGAELPFAADLLAASMRAGAAPDVAARCVGQAMPGPVGDRLSRVDRALRFGATAGEAWAYLGDLPGAGRITQAAVRSQHSGAAFAGSLQRVADDLRADALIAADAAGRRAGVLIVLPLGLCFLPAFVLAGLVPVIVAVLGDVLSS